MIPVFEPVFGDEEIQAVVETLRKGEISGSFSPTLERFEREFAAYVGCKYGVACTSGTTALHLAVATLQLSHGDEVLISACTNIATALAVAHNGGIPVPVDSENITWNLDLDKLESLITSKTRAVLPVHLYGHPVDMDRLLAITRKHDLVVIEDCAESHGATCREKMTGSFGDMGCFSFYANKIITTGEGGMVTTDNERLAEQLRLLRNLGFTKPRFRHEVAGYNFRMTGYQAAMGLAQLHKIERIIDEKRRVAQTYNKYLKGIPGIQPPPEAAWARNVYWMYALVVNSDFGITRDQLIEYLTNDGVDCRTFFCPMNQQPCLQKIEGFRIVPCPVADRLWETGLYLPSTHTLPEDTIRLITDSIRRAYIKKT